MLLTDDEIQDRLESPLNLMNRLKEISGKKEKVSYLPEKEKKPVKEDDDDFNNQSLAPVSDSLPFQPPSIEELIDNFENRIRAGQIVNSALEVMQTTVDQLRVRVLDDDVKPEKLSRIAGDMSKVIDSFRGEKKGSNPGSIIVWKPIMVNENRYESVIGHD